MKTRAQQRQEVRTLVAPPTSVLPIAPAVPLPAGENGVLRTNHKLTRLLPNKGKLT